MRGDIDMGYWPERDAEEDARNKRKVKQKAESRYTPPSIPKRPGDDNLPSSIDSYVRNPLNDINRPARERIYNPANQVPPIYGGVESRYMSERSRFHYEAFLVSLILVGGIVGGAVGNAVYGGGFGLTMGLAFGMAIVAYPVIKYLERKN